jgi:hypothetical protein
MRHIVAIPARRLPAEIQRRDLRRGGWPQIDCGAVVAVVIAGVIVVGSRRVRPNSAGMPNGVEPDIAGGGDGGAERPTETRGM